MTMVNDAREREREERALTIQDFCYLENITKATYYKLKRNGLGPEETNVLIEGARLVRITAEARRAWHAKLKAQQLSQAGQLEAARRKAQTSAAGKAGAASELHISKQRPSPSRRRRRRK